jgi:ketosteroid isomerase-like protein
MSARDEIEELIAKLYWAIDDGDREGFRSCITDDCVIIGAAYVNGRPVRVEGSEAIMRNWGRSLDFLHKEQHFFSNLLLRVDGDSAVARIYQWGPHIVPVEPGAEEEALPKEANRVEHSLRRTADGWRIAVSAYTPTWVENSSGLQRVKAQIFGAGAV